MPRAKHIPIDRILKLVTVDLERGVLFWRERSAPESGSKAWCDYWNKTHANKPVSVRPASHNGRKVKLAGTEYYLHRLIYALAHNKQPEQIDHIDGNRSNNCISNLRASSYAQNMKNKALYKNNSLGEANITRRKERAGVYVVCFKVDGKKRKFGSFRSIEAAIARRDEVKQLLGYDKNHGRAA